MTERKPPGVSFTSWIDQLVSEASDRGAFDDLPGAGKPLPRRAGSDDSQGWLREYLRRESISPDVLLPEPLKLLKARERLADAAADLDTEQQVRDAAADLNTRIIRWRKIPLGPPVFVPLADEDALVARWRGRHQPEPPSSPTASAPDFGPDPPRRRRDTR